jgi:CubicO group peptidase (beta-lactamase class C family)
MVSRTSLLLLAGLTIAKSVSGQKPPDLKKLDAYIANAMTQLDQPGLAVGIVQDGALIWSKGYGKLDLAKPEPVTANSLFYCASISKAFTACAVGLLVDDGKLDWNDPVRNSICRSSPHRTPT